MGINSEVFVPWAMLGRERRRGEVGRRDPKMKDDWAKKNNET